MSSDSRAEHWRRVEEVYHAAVGLPPIERGVYLDGACRSDVQLRHDVDVLLSVTGDAEPFLESNAHAMVGRRIGPYQITARLGASGMGEVYRATDSRLGRDVAIKIVPPLLISDPERLARFEREARLLAALNHPHIGGIYGVEETDGVRALVLELVNGQTLAERLTAGPLPIDEAIPIARQIAAGARGGARERDRPPRSEALEHQDHAAGDRQSARLRTRDR